MIGEGLGVGQVFEAGMLICFGVSWPIAILKTWRSRRIEGKSMGFLVLVFLGYLCGTAAKFMRVAGTGAMPEPVTALYMLNAVFVATDLFMMLHFKALAKLAAKATDGAVLSAK